MSEVLWGTAQQGSSGEQVWIKYITVIYISVLTEAESYLWWAIWWPCLVLVLCPHYLPWDLHNFNHLHKLMVIWSPSKLSFYSCEFSEPCNRTGIFGDISVFSSCYSFMYNNYFYLSGKIFWNLFPSWTENVYKEPVSVVCLIPSYIVKHWIPPWKAITNKLI